MDGVYIIIQELEHDRRVRHAEANIRRLGYGRRGIEEVPLERLPVRRFIAALARRLERWAAGTPVPTVGSGRSGRPPRAAGRV